MSSKKTRPGPHLLPCRQCGKDAVSGYAGVYSCRACDHRVDPAVVGRMNEIQHRQVVALSAIHSKDRVSSAELERLIRACLTQK